MKQPMNLLRAVVITALLGITAVYPLRADSNGWVTTTQTFALHIDVVNTCNGNDVLVNGTGYVLTHTKVQNGTVVVRETDLLGGTGTTSAAKYIFGEAAKINISTGANPDGTPFSYTERRTQILVGIGVPDQIITYNIHLVIDGNGNVITDIFDAKVVCH